MEELKYDPGEFESIQAKIVILDRKEEGMSFKDNLKKFRKEWKGDIRWYISKHSFVKKTLDHGWPPVPVTGEL